MTDKCEVKVLQDHDGRAGYGLCGRPTPCPDHRADRPGWAYGPSASTEADAALAAQDAETDDERERRHVADAEGHLAGFYRTLPQAEEDEGASPKAWGDAAGVEYIGNGTWQLKRPDEPALDENCLPLPPGKEPWRIRDLSSLEWAFKQKAEADKEATENLARAEVEVAELEKEIARLRERAASINEPLVKRAAFFESHIRVYAEQNRAEILGSGRRKSRKFLHGELAWKERKEGHYRMEKTPEAKGRLLMWARENEVAEDGTFRHLYGPSDHDVVYRDNVEAYLQFATQKTGIRQVAPGLEWVPPGETLEVKTGES